MLENKIFLIHHPCFITFAFIVCIDMEEVGELTLLALDGDELDVLIQTVSVVLEYSIIAHQHYHIEAHNNYRQSYTPFIKILEHHFTLSLTYVAICFTKLGDILLFLLKYLL